MRGLCLKTKLIERRERQLEWGEKGQGTGDRGQRTEDRGVGPFSSLSPLKLLLWAWKKLKGRESLESES